MDAHIVSNRGKIVNLDVSREIHYVLKNQGYLLPRDLVACLTASRSMWKYPTYSEILQQYQPLKIAAR